MADVLVLGAGLNGLATAMLRARDNHHVTLLERELTEALERVEALGGRRLNLVHGI
jgi:2-polyprenyl-6-methoxyphenol hydroxylase-like FAD-dependent oxidoreductase